MVGIYNLVSSSPPAPQPSAWCVSSCVIVQSVRLCVLSPSRCLCSAKRTSPSKVCTITQGHSGLCLKLIQSKNKTSQGSKTNTTLLFCRSYSCLLISPDPGNSSGSTGQIILALWHCLHLGLAFLQTLLGRQHISEITWKNNNRANISFWAVRCVDSGSGGRKLTTFSMMDIFATCCLQESNYIFLIELQRCWTAPGQ